MTMKDQHRVEVIKNKQRAVHQQDTQEVRPLITIQDEHPSSKTSPVGQGRMGESPAGRKNQDSELVVDEKELHSEN